MSYAKKKLPIGKKFNKLTILKEIPTTEKCRRYVYCRCECGSKKIIRFDSLQSGRIRSCSCLLSVKNEKQIEKMLITRRRNKDKRLAEEYLGLKFNKLTIESIYHHPKYQETWFNVKCDCGKSFQTSLMKLKTGHTKSCGCIRRKDNFKKYISEIDGEELLISSGNYQYCTLLKSDKSNSKEQLHVHEAKKLFAKIGKDWQSTSCVHHIDGNKKNNNLDNLAIIEKEKHRIHHDKMEKAMYDFLKTNNMLEQFYNQNPELKLEKLSDLLNKYDLAHSQSNNTFKITSIL